MIARASAFQSARASTTLPTRANDVSAHHNPKANDMRISPLEAAAILIIGIVTMQLHSAERTNPALAIQAFVAASSDRVMARLEERTAKSTQLPATAAFD
jgi:hypothetical protein